MFSANISCALEERGCRETASSWMIRKGIVLSFILIVRFFLLPLQPLLRN